MPKWVLSAGEFRLSGYAIRKLVELGSEVVEKLTLAEWYGGDDFLPDYADDLKRCIRITDNYRMCPVTGALFRDGDVYWFKQAPYVRRDPSLVAVVELLGKQAAGANCLLRIVEVPDDVVVELKHRPGIEWLEEKHRIWR